MVWSHGLDGRNLSVACFSNTLEYSVAYIGTSLLSGISFLPWFAAMAILVDLFVFQITAWVSHRLQIALDGLCVKWSSLTIESSLTYDMTRYGSMEVSGSPYSIPSGGSCVCWCSYIICCFLMTWSLNVIHPFCQFMVGLYLLIHGIPRIASSIPKSATYYLMGSLCSLILKCPSTQWVIIPFLFILSSAFQKVRGLGNCTVGNQYLSTTQVFIIATSAPVSIRLLTPMALSLTLI